jgi:transcription antitermination factor NusG
MNSERTVYPEIEEKTKYGQPSWFAIYTKSRWEKRVWNDLLKHGYEAYLPLKKTLRQWTDRKKWVDIPIVTSYVFVHVTPEEYRDILEFAGVVCYLTFEGKAVPISPRQINTMKIILGHDDGKNVEVTRENFAKGEKVRVAHGPMKGAEGEIIVDKAKHKLLVRIDQIGFNMVVKIDKALLKKQK